MRTLSSDEARVVGVLVEKQATVPDSYPLSLNALSSGCNQKTARHPVLALSDADVLTALDSLKALSLVFEVSGSRVVRFEHNLGRVLGVPSQAVALLALLMLRGPQTAAELRLNAERLHRFADVSSVEGFLDELAAREPPAVLRLARAPGEREPRWVHCLCGQPAEADVAPSNAPLPDSTRLDGGEALRAIQALEATVAALADAQAQLRSEVESLRAQVRRLADDAGAG
ncbi:MAG: YceH family protein [Rubrivivax sp.]